MLCLTCIHKASSSSFFYCLFCPCPSVALPLRMQLVCDHRVPLPLLQRQDSDRWFVRHQKVCKRKQDKAWGAEKSLAAGWPARPPAAGLASWTAAHVAAGMAGWSCASRLHDLGCSTSSTALQHHNNMAPPNRIMVPHHGTTSRAPHQYAQHALLAAPPCPWCSCPPQSGTALPHLATHTCKTGLLRGCVRWATSG